MGDSLKVRSKKREEYSKAQIKKREEYLATLPSVVVLELKPELTPIAMIVLALVKADVRSIPLMFDILKSRSRNAIYRASVQLKDQGYVITHKNLWYEIDNFTEKQAKEHAVKYWRSKRNPNGRVSRQRNGVDWGEKVKQFEEAARKSKNWVTDEH